MTPQLIFNGITTIIVANFVFELLLDYLNFRHFNDPIPKELEGIYDKEDYQKSQNYKTDNFKFGLVQSTFSFVLLLLFINLNGFKLLDDFVRQFTDNSLFVSLLYFGFFFITSTLISIPFSFYQSFVIEARFGFNKMAKSLFVKDLIKSFALTLIIGGIILSLILWFFEQYPKTFWIYTWIFIAFFSLLMNLFYTSLIVPLFNKLTPIEAGTLKDLLCAFALKVNFKIDKIYMIDGSKRSTKANAFFSGFGKTKKVVLYDTLLNDLSNDEIVAVLAHEVGHYKKNHILYNFIINILQIGVVLYILSLFINNSLLAQSLGLKQTSFHIGLFVFMILYTPISVLTGLIMAILSRKFEYQADNFAKLYGYSEQLISALKKLSKLSYSNLTPHRLYVFIHYSHPTIFQRIINLKQKVL